MLPWAAAEQLVAATLEKHDRIDVLINCVGANIRRRTSCGLTDKNWMMIDVNLSSALSLTQAIAPGSPIN